jgi:hypothetical protein
VRCISECPLIQPSVAYTVASAASRSSANAYIQQHRQPAGGERHTVGQTDRTSRHEQHRQQLQQQ